MEVELPVLGSERGSGSQVCKRSTSNVDGCYRSNETISHATTSRRAKYLRASALQRRLCMRHRRHVRVRVRVRLGLKEIVMESLVNEHGLNLFSGSSSCVIA